MKKSHIARFDQSMSRPLASRSRSLRSFGETFGQKQKRIGDKHESCPKNVKYKRKERCSTNGYCQTFSSKALKLSLPIADPQKKNTLEVETNGVLVHQCTSFLKWLASTQLGHIPPTLLSFEVKTFNSSLRFPSNFPETRFCYVFFGTRYFCISLELFHLFISS